jgi:hypothetical protein
MHTYRGEYSDPLQEVGVIGRVTRTVKAPCKRDIALLGEDAEGFMEVVILELG